MPRISIVIPTYNRAGFLGRAIESALDQTHDDVEVIISDNASTDETPEVVRKYGDRVRYHRNPTNIGMWPNLALSPELATGEFFSWLQDDDLIRRDFAARAVRGLSSSEDADLYICWAAYSASSTSLGKWTTIHGPVLPVDWLGSGPTLVDGLLLVPFAFFESQALPPAVAFRTGAARLGVKDLLQGCDLYNEQVVIQSIAARGRVVIDPWIGAIHSHHEAQGHLVLGGDQEGTLRQRLIHAEYCQRLMAGLPDRWRGLFRGCLAELPVEARFRLIDSVIHYYEKRAAFWASAPPVVREMRDIVLEALPEQEREKFRWIHDGPDRGPKGRLKRVIPPRLWNTFRAARTAWNQGVA